MATQKQINLLYIKARCYFRKSPGYILAYEKEQMERITEGARKLNNRDFDRLLKHVESCAKLIMLAHHPDEFAEFDEQEKELFTELGI